MGALKVTQTRKCDFLTLHSNFYTSKREGLKTSEDQTLCTVYYNIMSRIHSNHLNVVTVNYYTIT